MGQLLEMIDLSTVDTKLNKISEKILFGSPRTINKGLFFTNKNILFNFVKIN